MKKNKYRSPSIAEARVYRDLKKGIISGLFPPGCLLIQEKLCCQFHISRTPVRDALTHLQAEGLVVAMPNKGVFVRELSAKDVHDIYEIRLLLESAAARDAARKADKKELESILKEILQLSQKRSVSFETMKQIGAKFHRLIVVSSGNKIMKDILDRIGVLIDLSRIPFKESGERSKQINWEHVEIIEALLKGKGEMAADLLRTHLLRNREAHLNLMLGSTHALVNVPNQ